MALITGVTCQNTPFEQYKLNDDYPTGCRPGDEVFYNGSENRVCSRPDPNFCAYPIGPTRGVLFVDANVSGCDGINGLPLWCGFAVTQFSTINDINRFTAAFGRNDDWNNILMPFFCSQPNTNCASDAITGLPVAECSNFLAIDGSGQECQTWFDTNPSAASASMNEFCSLRPDNPNCKCIARTSNILYQIAKTGQSKNDGCWWIACSNQDSYLVTEDLRGPDCSGNYCQVINNNIVDSGSNVTEGEVVQNINCNFGGGGTTIPFWVWILFGIGLLIIVVALLYIAYRPE